MNLHGKRLHFMGIGGIGMSALAAVAHLRGAIVDGCDHAPNEQTQNLQQRGISILIGHSPTHTREIDYVIHTSAIPLTHPELQNTSAKIMRRGEFLAELLRENRVIGVSGAHGKTTTTWMISHLFLCAERNPTILLGGAVNELNGNYRVGEKLAITELDESDGSFLLPRIECGVITNIEAEHLAYYRTLNKVVEAFTKFAEQITEENYLVANLDNEYSRQIYQSRRGKKIGYALTPNEHWYAKNITYADGFQHAQIFRGEKFIGDLALSFAGAHNLSNALAVFAVAEIYDLNPQIVIDSFRNCRGVKRRWEKISKYNDTNIFSDYAHHPTEITATLTGARQLQCGKILVVYQPHLYSRTRDNAENFAHALNIADGVIMVDIYPAREEPIDGVTSALISEKIAPHKLVNQQPLNVDDAVTLAKKIAHEYDTIIFMGAGNIDVNAARLIASTQA